MWASKVKPVVSPSTLALQKLHWKRSSSTLKTLPARIYNRKCKSGSVFMHKGYKNVNKHKQDMWLIYYQAYSLRYSYSTQNFGDLTDNETTIKTNR